MRIRSVYEDAQLAGYDHDNDSGYMTQLKNSTYDSDVYRINRVEECLAEYWFQGWTYPGRMIHYDHCTIKVRSGTGVSFTKL